MCSYDPGIIQAQSTVFGPVILRQYTPGVTGHVAMKNISLTSEPIHCTVLASVLHCKLKRWHVWYWLSELLILTERFLLAP